MSLCSCIMETCRVRRPHCSTMGAVLLWGSLCLTGVWSLSGPNEVTIPYGETLSVVCRYHTDYSTHSKYWCKGEERQSCNVLITSDNSQMVINGRFSIVDNQESHTFTVTTSGMRPKDSDTYQCGIYRFFSDTMFPVKVTVLPGVCKKTSRWASLVDFPTSFTYIKENEDVEVSCQNRFESRTFQLKCRQEYDEFQLYQDHVQIPCIERCRRLTSWRGNVTIYPEQDYYDPEEEVTLTCSPGYEPNYSKIKCMRGNNTNIWNETEVFCRQKIYPPKKCRRLTSWRGNVTVYPEQDYYDPEEEVTLMCSPGYEPNYSKIKCMRSNNTNIWNMTEVFCRQKIYPPTSPPYIKELTESSWRKVLVSWTFGLMPPMAIKLMTILTIVTVRIFSIIRTRYKSTQEVVMSERSSQQEMTNVYSEI
ncbi:uncharacterized protein LOC142110235 isoform X2 [Mixophyes fleayi]|uniref:uncharacterized protein LOC142110235 isoform X2 n=1 Tax=Mixophyes fleayi TaxID=3061075 RepID=UPI003F4E2BAD